MALLHITWDPHKKKKKFHFPHSVSAQPGKQKSSSILWRAIELADETFKRISFLNKPSNTIQHVASPKDN
jgi:hypothetical protein